MDEKQVDEVAEALLAPARAVQEQQAERRDEARRKQVQRLPIAVCALLGLVLGGVIAAQVGMRVIAGFLVGTAIGALVGHFVARARRPPP